MIKVNMPYPDSGVARMLKDYAPFDVQFVNLRENPDLLVYTGGADVNPELYGEKRHKTTSISKVRDDQDRIAFNTFPTLPKVGICRGGQMLNVLSGGRMYQNVSNHTRSHYVVNLIETKSHNPGDRVFCTSTHHQMMIPGEQGVVIGIAQEEGKGIADLYETYDSVKTEQDYDTEIVWYEHSNSLCFQPHPEYEIMPCRTYFMKLLTHFFPQFIKD